MDKKECSSAISKNDKNRYYGFFIMTYNTNQSDFQPLLDKAFKSAWILHDRDKATPHVHIIVTFKQHKSEEYVKKLITGGQNTFCEVLKNKYKAFEYLTHENEDEEKARYEESDIHCDDFSYFQKGLSKSVDNEEFVLDLLDKKMTAAQKIIKYGRDYARNFKAYESLAKRLRFEDKLQKCVDNGELIELPERGENYYAIVKTGEVVQLLFDPDSTKNFSEIEKESKGGENVV